MDNGELIAVFSTTVTSYLSTLSEAAPAMNIGALLMSTTSIVNNKKKFWLKHRMVKANGSIPTVSEFDFTVISPLSDNSNCSLSDWRKKRGSGALLRSGSMQLVFVSVSCTTTEPLCASSGMLTDRGLVSTGELPIDSATLMVTFAITEAILGVSPLSLADTRTEYRL